jgi:hypothetical protein
VIVPVTETQTSMRMRVLVRDEDNLLREEKTTFTVLPTANSVSPKTQPTA